MNYSGFFTVAAIAVVLAFISWLIDLSLLLPLPLAYFALALLSGVIALTLDSPAISAGALPGSANTRKKTGKERGEVKWFSARKGFGFITRENGDEIFVHFRSIIGDGHRVLKEGQLVEYVVGSNDKGLQAEDVVTLN